MNDLNMPSLLNKKQPFIVFLMSLRNIRTNMISIHVMEADLLSNKATHSSLKIGLCNVGQYKKRHPVETLMWAFKDIWSPLDHVSMNTRNQNTTKKKHALLRKMSWDMYFFIPSYCAERTEELKMRLTHQRPQNLCGISVPLPTLWHGHIMLKRLNGVNCKLH